MAHENLNPIPTDVQDALSAIQAATAVVLGVSRNLEAIRAAETVDDEAALKMAAETLASARVALEAHLTAN